MSTPLKSDSNFQKKTKSKLVAHMQRKLDDFIQNSLDKYHFVDVSQKMLDVASVFSRHIVSNKSAIPDLVIYNKKFNKNDCFHESDQDIYLPFPRIRFILKAKPRSEIKPIKETPGETNESQKTQQRNLLRKGEKEIHEKEVKKNDFQFKDKTQGKNLIPMSINSLFEIEQDTKENTSEQIKEKNNSEAKDLETEIENPPKELSENESFSYINKCLNDDDDSFKNAFEPQQSFESNASEDNFVEEKGSDQNSEFPALFADYSLFTKRKSTPVQKNTMKIIEDEASHLNFNKLNTEDVFSTSMKKQKLNVNFENNNINYRDLCNNNVSNFYYPNSNQINDKTKRDFVSIGEINNLFNTETFPPENNILNLIKKNSIKRDWLLLENSIITRNFNSFELFQFFNDLISCGKSISSLCIINHETNSSFNPIFLYEKIKENLPELFDNTSKETELSNNASRTMLDKTKINKFNNLNINNNYSNFPFNFKNPPVMNFQISYENNNNLRQFNHNFTNITGNNTINQRNTSYNYMNSPLFNNNMNIQNISQRSNPKSVSPINFPQYNMPLMNNQISNYNNLESKNKFNHLNPINASMSDLSNDERNVIGYPHSTKNMFVNPLRNNPGIFQSNKIPEDLNNYNGYRDNNGVMFNFFQGVNNQMNPVKANYVNEVPHEIPQRELEKSLPFNNKFSAIDKFSHNLQVINSN